VNARRVATAGVIAAVYGALTFLVIQVGSVFSWGLVQLRLSEALTVVACLTPAAVPGLALGAALANLTSVASMGDVGLLDVVFGALGTLLGAAWSWRFRRRTAVALLGPVVFNALIVPAYLPVMLKAAHLGAIPLFGISLASSWWLLYLFGVLSIGISQTIVVYGLGWPLLTLLKRVPLPGLETASENVSGRGGAGSGGRS
jgi:uncharacterized membrane protein